MKYSGLYYVNNASGSLDDALKTANALVQGVETSFPTATRHRPWTLTYRVFRDTAGRESTVADADARAKPHAHSYQHMFHLSSLAPDRAHVYVQPPEGSGIVTAIPLHQQDAHASLLRHQHAALWVPRHVLAVPHGVTYAGGLFTVQVGELRATREGPQSGGMQSPGVVVCISTALGRGDDDADADDEQRPGCNPPADDTASDQEAVDFEHARSLIRGFWASIIDGRDLGRSEAREVMMAPEHVGGEKEKDAAVRMWCEALRLRG